MRVGLNMLFVAPGRTGGIETYAKGLLKALCELRPTDQFIVFITRTGAEHFGFSSSNLRYVMTDAPLGNNRVLKNFYEQVVLPLKVAKERVDILHSLAYVGPIASLVPQVITIHDMNFYFKGHALHGVKATLLAWLCHLTAIRSRSVVAVSRFTKDEISKFWPKVGRKTSVVYEGPGLTPIKVAAENRNRAFLAFVGGGRHKNSELVVRAFGCLPACSDWELLLVGPVGPDLKRELSQLPSTQKAKVRELGFLPKNELDKLFPTVGCVIVPSRYEGFGLPVIEAQSQHVPVLCSTAASLPEIAGTGAAFFDPDDTFGLSKLMHQIMTSAEMRNCLILSGLRNVKRFSWESIAAQTMHVYQNAVDSIANQI